MTVVALALSDRVPIYELAAPCAIFGSRAPRGVEGWYELQVCSPRNARVDEWFRAATEFTYDDLVQADTVVVPACHDLQPSRRLVEAVRAAYDRGARVMSICTGAFVLAEAGILNELRATTHWMYATTLAERYPSITVDPDVLYVDEGRVLTSAGKAAGHDLCLHVVRRDFGAAVANHIARRLVMPPHREGGQAQYIATSVPHSLSDDLAPVLDWALTHLDQAITVEDLARRAHLGTRTLNRHFHARVGTNPLQWLHGQRIRRAQELLEQTDLPVEIVSQRVGLTSAAVLRRHFRRALDTTPDAYRRTFRGARPLHGTTPPASSLDSASA
ncbi:helix-turn-helix domain-containing protein [Actinocrispum wychmicini]|uniref:Transcriptional regulator GlxA family with amidase domain n=1 Tax=Actinocrispum wychmicini TaxID=1213861 RepID=A0A4V6NP06_9PSEU|nr:helix-turn-helix domain-containing protein [Actinocrispum wychmicini]TCO62120.1 transcriptional regulator GlxA family with amidase domain [Actinocrispum wychmicini]